jgi:tetrahydromethanopterin S-methyltransferase subunit A
MRALARHLPGDPGGENPMAVRLFGRLYRARDLLGAGPLRRRWQRLGDLPAWPVVAGDYRVGDASAGVAVCTLSSRDLIEPVARLPGVAIAGRLITVNLGIEHLVTNLVANPRIRALVLCGNDSPVFHTAQAVRALVEHGVTAEHRIIGARGHWPVLANLSATQIARFREQIALIKVIGTSDLSLIAAEVRAAAARVETLPALSAAATEASSPPAFKRIAAGGKREPVGYDPNGFFIITLDAAAGEIVCRHYTVDHAPAHEVRSRSAERVWLALLREDLISKLSHAAYLGAELAKAESALRLGLRYEQDKPVLRP